VSETSEQKVLIAWFRRKWPEYAHCLRVSLSGLNFGSGRRGAIMTNHVRSLGIHPGEADILLALPRDNFGSLVIELKRTAGQHGYSVDQLAYLERHNSVGNCAVGCDGIEHAKEVVTRYMAGEVS
jgi:hypothetical protein